MESPLKNGYGGEILGEEGVVNAILANIERFDLESEEIVHRNEHSGNIHAKEVDRNAKLKLQIEAIKSGKSDVQV